ncbi:hypothetical protein IPZ70_06940 [Streptomyces polychromogenes]|nr:hypothetical protein [Streptomyces polychromogenes]
MLIGPLAYPAVLGATCCVILVCAALAALLRAPEGERTDRSRESDTTGWATEAKAGFRAIRRVVPEWRLALLTMVVDFALFPVFALVVPVLVAAHYPGKTWVLSIVESAFGMGMIAGSAVLIRKSNSLLGRRRTVPAGFALPGSGFIGTGLVFGVTGPAMPVAFTVGSSALLMLSGAGLCMVTVNTGTVRLLATPSSHRNRMVVAGAVRRAATTLSASGAGSGSARVPGGPGSMTPRRRVAGGGIGASRPSPSRVDNRVRSRPAASKHSVHGRAAHVRIGDEAGILTTDSATATR